MFASLADTSAGEVFQHLEHLEDIAVVARVEIESSGKGIVPADHQIFLQESIDSLFDRYMSIRDQVTTFIAGDMFDDHALITPNCGIRFADEQGASDIMNTAAELSRRVRSIRR